MGIDYSVNLGKLNLHNPLIAASGTFGYGNELNDIMDINDYGAVTTKTITLEPRAGNDNPRILETSAGLLNSIGLQNIGLKNFIDEILPYWGGIKTTKLIVSVGGNDINEYVEICKILDSHKRINALELNISCPNVKKGCLAIGTDINAIQTLLQKIKLVTTKTIIVKLSPNVSNLVAIAKCCEENKADIISLVNTFLGMAIDIENRKPYFKNIIAGYSGPAIKPMALKLVYDIRRKINIPIIGMGGITNYKDVLEFIIAGANAVSIGTANFINPNVAKNILHDLNEYCKKNNIQSLTEFQK